MEFKNKNAITPLLLGFIFNVYYIILIILTCKDYVIGTIILSTAITFSGIYFCKQTIIKTQDSKLRLLYILWLIKLAVTLSVLVVGWVPNLHIYLDTGGGYDPMRYYYQAKMLIDNGWSVNFISLNYTGILYYYAIIYYVFGFNPFVPALINCVVSLLAVLYLITELYNIKTKNTSLDWTAALLLLIPEILWYDVMTSRETLMASLLIFILITTGRYLFKTSFISFNRLFIILSFSLFGVLTVRTSMAFPVMISIFLFLILKKDIANIYLYIMLALLTLLFLLPQVSSFTHSASQLDYNDLIQNRIAGTGITESLANQSWNENSIGKLLIPNGFIQAVLFFPARFIIYVVTPLPAIHVPINDLIDGYFGAWENLFVILTSCVHLIVFPYASAFLLYSIKTKKENLKFFVLNIPFWVSFSAVVGGNFIIHPRYRVMSITLMWACAWMGMKEVPRYLVRKVFVVWFGCLALGGFFYLFYKL